MFGRSGWVRNVLVVVVLGAVAPAAADPLLTLDAFDGPTAPGSAVVIGPPVTSSDSAAVRDFEPGVIGGVRESWLHVYDNEKSSASVLSVGAGRLSTAQGAGAIAETIISYGAFTRPTGDPSVGGPLLNLDLSGFGGLKFDFSAVEHGLNVNVTYYTSEPLDPAAPLYYSGSGINVAPTAPGEPLSFVLPFADRDGFNWKRVDGVIVIINRAGPTPSTSYTLDNLAFTSASR